ncbi:MAG: N-acetylmuramoyl-L-alanine amidase, partial [Sarcina sp.]
MVVPEKKEDKKEQGLDKKEPEKKDDDKKQEDKKQEVKKEEEKKENPKKDEQKENPKKEEDKAIPVINGIKVDKELINMNYSKGMTIVPKYIVIHDTDNRAVTANAMANRNYFGNHPEAKASAHYVVDEANIIQVLEDNWRGWHIGDGHNPLITNSNTIGIELCVNRGNNFDKTLENGIALTKYLMKKYNIPAKNIVRHHDCSGKICPKMMMEDRPDLWPYFKSRIAGNSAPIPKDNFKAIGTGRVVNVSSVLNVRLEAYKSAPVISTLTNNQYVNVYGEENGWYKIDYLDNNHKKYGYVSKDYLNFEKKNKEEQKQPNKP